MTMWVFGYGSLVWNPGFDVHETAIATLADYQRSFCMRSVHHRGTHENPGLVLALDAHSGANCRGVGLSVVPGQEATVLEYLRERELISSAYLERNLHITLDDGRRVEAVAYVIDPDHVQYCGAMPLEEQAEIIARAVGGRGPNTEYLFNTADQLKALGVEDRDMHWLTTQVRLLTSG